MIYNVGAMRQRWIIFILVVFLAGCVLEAQMVKIHPNCPEIPATTFKAAGLDAKSGALNFGQVVTVGETSIKADPKIISGISQGVRDDQITDALICAAKERGELSSGEQVNYAWSVARFYNRTNPTADQAIRFHKENPFPATPRSERKGNNPQIASIRKLIGEGYALKDDIEREYRFHHQQPNYSENEESLLKGWNSKADAWKKTVLSTLQGIDPILVGRFNNVQSSPFVLLGESIKWNALNNYLNARIDFLNQYLDKVPAFSELDSTEIQALKDSITGGDSFAYITFLLQFSPPRPILLHQGKYPLYDVTARILDLGKVKPGAISLSDLEKSDILDIGNLGPHHSRMLNPVSLPNDSLRWNISFNARNQYLHRITSNAPHRKSMENRSQGCNGSAGRRRVEDIARNS